MKNINGINIFETTSEIEQEKATSNRLIKRGLLAIKIGLLTSALIVVVWAWLLLTTSFEPGPVLIIVMAAPASLAFIFLLVYPQYARDKERRFSPCDSDTLSALVARAEKIPEAKAVVQAVKAQERGPTIQEANELLNLIERRETEEVHARFVRG